MSNIEKIGQLRDDIKAKIVEMITSTLLKRNEFNESYTLFNNNNLYFSKNSEKGRSKQHCVIAVFCREIYTKLTITIAVEVLNKEFIAECCKEFDRDDLEGCIKKDALKKTRADWAHIATILQQITTEDFQNISGVVEDLIFNKSISVNHPNVTIFSIFEKVNNFYDTLYTKTQ